MKKIWNAALVAVAATVCAAGCAEPTSEDVGSVESEFRTILDGDHEHDDLTEAGLPFLRDNLVERLGDINEETDSKDTGTKLQSRYHFDNCRVGDAFDVINQHLETALEAANPEGPQYNVIEESFGRVLHTSQDFYAHSNWVEAGQVELVDSSALFWPAVEAGSAIGEMVVLGDVMPEWRISRADGSRVPQFWDGSAYRMGLMTGTYADNTDSSLCPESVAIPHGDHVTIGHYDYDEYLAKDNPRSAHHEVAADFAVRQTTEELCRFFRLVTIRYGQDGADSLRSAWVSDAAGFDAACGHNAGIVASIWMSALGT